MYNEWIINFKKQNVIDERAAILFLFIVYLAIHLWIEFMEWQLKRSAGLTVDDHVLQGQQASLPSGEEESERQEKTTASAPSASTSQSFEKHEKKDKERDLEFAAAPEPPALPLPSSSPSAATVDMSDGGERAKPAVTAASLWVSLGLCSSYYARAGLVLAVHSPFRCIDACVYLTPQSVS